jgi:DegV family protein with EDD domain
MERPYVIVTDAAADFLPGETEKYKIDVVPMEIDMGGNIFRHYAYKQDTDLRKFYGQLRKGVVAKTSQITPQSYCDFFRPVLKCGNDILYIAFSGSLSGTCDSARFAAKILLEEFAGFRLCVVDSVSALGGQGMLACRAAENRDAGMTIEENKAWCEAHRLKTAHCGTVDDLMYLERGGRINAVSAYFGTALNLKPVISMDDEGHLPVRCKVHGRRMSLKKVAGYLRENIENPEGQEIRIFHSDCPEDAETLKKMIQELHLPIGDIRIGEVGPVVGSHLGPGAVALFFQTKHR